MAIGIKMIKPSQEVGKLHAALASNRMTKYGSPMGSLAMPLPVAPRGEVLNTEQKVVLEKALNELSRRKHEKEAIIDAARNELRRRRMESN